MAWVLACGAFLKNTACLWDAQHSAVPLWSQLHGDLSDPAACQALERSAQALLEQANKTVCAVAHDLHPDFYSTRLAQQLAHTLQVPSVAVQHHHAHIAAVLAEHGVDESVLGLALDGVGLGSDGTAWGGEVLWVQGCQFERVGHLLPLGLPGGDVAAREPWRMAAAALHACGLASQIVPWLAGAVGETSARTVQTMLERGLRCPPTSAAGRWFDAAAGLLGLSVRQEVEAQAAMALEQAAARHVQRSPEPLPVQPQDWCIHPDGSIDLRPLVQHWTPQTGRTPEALEEAAARFHCALADALVAHAVAAARERGVRSVALGGGCFFNRILRQRIVDGLESAALRVLLPQAHSFGDAALALGQAWVAAAALRARHPTHQESIVCV